MFYCEKSFARVREKSKESRVDEVSGLLSRSLQRIQENKYLSRNCVCALCLLEIYSFFFLDGVKLLSLSFRSERDVACSRERRSSTMKTALLELHSCRQLLPKRIYCVFSPLKSVLQESHNTKLRWNSLSNLHIKCASSRHDRSRDKQAKHGNGNKLILTHVTSLKKSNWCYRIYLFCCLL